MIIISKEGVYALNDPGRGPPNNALI